MLNSKISILIVLEIGKDAHQNYTDKYSIIRFMWVNIGSAGTVGDQQRWVFYSIVVS